MKSEKVYRVEIASSIDPMDMPMNLWVNASSRNEARKKARKAIRKKGKAGDKIIGIFNETMMKPKDVRGTY